MTTNNIILEILEFFKTTSSIKLFEISLLNFFSFIITFSFILLFKNLLKKFIKKKIQYFFKKNKNVAENFDKTIDFLIFSVAFFISTIFLKDSILLKNFIDKINASLFTIIIFWTISKLIQPLFFRVKN